jgi:hypothetical protein
MWTLDEAGVVQKFGVTPESIPDYLALVGDAADGYSGLPVGARSPPRQCWRSFFIWNPFLWTVATGE